MGLLNGWIAKGVWEKITSSEQYDQSMELEELEAYLDPALPQGLLDKEPNPPKKKQLYLSSKITSILCPRNVREAEICEASKYPENAWAGKTFTAWSKERSKLLLEDSVLRDLMTIVNCALFSARVLYFPPQCSIGKIEHCG